MASAARVKRAVTARAAFTVIPRIFSMVFTSPLPQYWAVRTVAPDVSPKRNRVMIYCTWPARDAPDSAVSPTAPSMMTSAAVTPYIDQILERHRHHQSDNSPIENAPVNTQGVILFAFYCET